MEAEKGPKTRGWEAPFKERSSTKVGPRGVLWVPVTYKVSDVGINWSLLCAQRQRGLPRMELGLSSLPRWPFLVGRHRRTI